MKQKIIQIIILIILLAGMLPVQSVIVEPGREWSIENEIYRVEQAMNFSRIIITDTYPIFNNTGWNISAPSNILIVLRYINDSTTDAFEDDMLLEFSVWMVSGSTTISISGFKSNVIHNIYKDSVLDSSFLSNSTGCINITISSATTFIYTVYKGANIAPVISSPFPTDGATGVSIVGSPVNIDAVDVDGNDMRTDVWTNASGTWTQVAGWDVYVLDINNDSRAFLIDYGTPGFNFQDLSLIHI